MMRDERGQAAEGVLTFLGIVALVLLVLLIFMWPFKKTPRDMIGLSYGGGLFEGAHFQGIVQPGSSLFFNGWGDKLYLYPVTQRNYIISKNPTVGDLQQADYVEAPSADRVPVQFEVSVYFKLNLDQIQKFHENIGLKYQAWTTDGWDQMLKDTFRPQVEFALQREARQYAVADIYANPQTLVQIQQNVGSVLKENVNQVLGDDYFCGPTYVAGSGTCPDFKFVINSITVPDNVKQAFEDNRTSQIEIVTKQNEVVQAKLEAQAIKERQQALDKCGEVCVLYDAVHTGQIQFWVIPQGNGLTVQAPAIKGKG